MPSHSGALLVCFAVPQEAKFFRAPECVRERVQVIVTGMGRRNAVRRLEEALEGRVFDHVFTCGFAGGLNPELARGTIVSAGAETPGLERLLIELGAAPSTIHCADRVACTRAEKEALRVKTGADAVEMESGWIAGVCRKQGIGCTTIRVISDGAGEDLPLDFNVLMTSDCQLDFKKLAWALLREPAKVRGLLQLHRQTRQAAQNLGAFLTELLRRYPSLAG